jgi:hypothetical protein
MSSRRLGALLLGVAPLVVGCFGEPKVVRVYDGRVVEGAFVAPEAYASYLRGVFAEEEGNLPSAIAAYEAAAREDDEDAEPLTRIGDLRCRLDPKDRQADEALSRALRIDRTYVPAISARARCLAARGKVDEALEATNEIAPADKKSANVEALVVRLAAKREGSAADALGRERAIALTLASADNPVAWDALIAWGRGKADAELLARGVEGLLRAAPNRHAEVEAGALELLGIGHAALARRVAGKLADSPASLEIGRIHDETVARLAVDDALLLGDSARAERRAVRGRVSLAEVAARAEILERPDLAAAFVRDVLAADPNSGCASMVELSLSARGASGMDSKAALEAQRVRSTPTDRPEAACVLVLAERLATFTNPDVVRDWWSHVAPPPMAPHDPVTGPLAVDLAARGLLDERSLPLELRLELAARRQEAPPAVDLAAVEKRVVDAKHALLWNLLVDPAGASTKALLSRLYGAADRDPIIGFALARSALASVRDADVWQSALRAIASSPSNPLLLAVAVEIAKKGGKPEDVPPARARLMAFARTPAERALATE